MVISNYICLFALISFIINIVLNLILSSIELRHIIRNEKYTEYSRTWSRSFWFIGAVLLCISYLYQLFVFYGF